ncbi:MAG: dNTP triphosphohydrolase [Erysipelotrichaceae bacterium]|nr:dNTP triphosphohydrolase [Erysipelotrichaceae bacterium]MCI9312165.1 dNTP triphosphohydrolase [Erysipelotrichaceae bacterium]
MGIETEHPTNEFYFENSDLVNEDNFFIIKLYEQSFENFLKNLSLNEGCCQLKGTEYRIGENDEKAFECMPAKMKLMFIVFKSGYKPKQVFACEGEKIVRTQSTGTKKCILCKTLAQSNHHMEVQNICKQLFFDLQKDFTSKTYITIETAVEIYDSFVNEYSARRKTKKQEVDQKPSDKVDLSQDSLAYPEALCVKCYRQEDIIGRSIFARDRDRIIHSKAFRRLVDKAQIFTSEKGDHYRTRMTHTLEVTQIARSIAKRLELNEELTEAIALAHDIGHTPFGHQGERTLNQILNGDIPIIQEINEVRQLQSGFKHNYQALRVLSCLELKYSKYQGINLSYQIMEGVWKHTKIMKDNSQENELLFPIETFFTYPNPEYLHPEYPFSTTLEGQVVAIADEIAQRAHDIDDAFKSHTVVIEELERISHFKKSRLTEELIERIKQDICEAKNDHIIFVDEQDMFRARLCSEIITFFVDRVVKHSKKQIDEYLKTNQGKEYIIKEKLIHWDEDTDNISESLQTLVNKKVINSAEVAQFDTTAENIIEKLFTYYYLHPLTLSDNTLKRVYLEFFKIKGAGVIDFRSGDVNLVREELNKITIEHLHNKPYREEYYQKRRILAQCISDHIGGMTDSFAIQEYHKLYHLKDQS